MTPAIMPWVCGTPLGRPVEPEVKRYFATVGWPRRSIAAATSGPAGVFVSLEKGTPPSPSTVTTAISGSSVRRTASAGANCAPLWAKTTLGRTVVQQCFSLAWSELIRLYAGLIGAHGTPAV
jgi:hypothetical protein